MAAFDKMILEEILIGLGWKADPNGELYLIPPDSLWEKKPKSYRVYDARDLQNILGEPVEEDD